MLNIDEASKKLYKFGSDLVGHRVFDLYLKYMGIKTLTTATLVPVALLLGKDAMEDFLTDVEQTGGAACRRKAAGAQPSTSKYSVRIGGTA